MSRKPKSDITKKYSRISVVFLILSILATTGPIIVFSVIGFCNGEVHQKITLGVTIIISILLLLINVIFKFHIRSVLWIVVLGIYFCLENIMPLLLAVAIGTILDEFLLSPLHKTYANKAKINREIDKRL